MKITTNYISDYQIIYPKDYSESVKYAAQELKSYIFKITGASMMIFQDDRHESSKEILIGYTNRGGYTNEEKSKLKNEGFIIRQINEKIYIIGSNERGALYGVYSFLEEYCGCRFYTRNFEKIPTCKELEINIENDNEQIPVFMYRNSCWHSVLEPKIATKLKMNGAHCRNESTPDYLGGAEEYYGGFCHTITDLTNGNDYWVQPCLTDDETYNKVIKNVQKILDEYPNAKIVSITQMDGNEGACKCDKCRAINEREESESGTNIWFVNKVAEHFENDYPNLIFDTFAYRFTRKPPKYIKPRKNVEVRFCTIECCNVHAIEDCNGVPGKDPSSVDAYNDIMKWKEISYHLSCWNYDTDFANYPVVFPNWRRFLKDERFFADNHFLSIFEQGSIDSENGEFSELKGYIVSRCLWNPYMSEEKYWNYIEEFVNDYYGSNILMEYIQLTLDASIDSHTTVYFDNPNKYFWCRDAESHEKGVELFIKRATDIFNRAEAACSNGFELSNVKRSRIQLFDYIDFYLRSIREKAENINDKEELTKKIIENNTFRFNYMKLYDVNYNREFNCLDNTSEVDLSDYGLRW